MITSFHNYLSENLILNKDYFPSKTNENIKQYLKPKSEENIISSLLKTHNPEKTLEYLYKNFDVKKYQNVVKDLMNRIDNNWKKAFINCKHFRVEVGVYSAYLYGCGLCNELTPLKIVDDRKMSYSGGIYSLYKCKKCGQYVIVDDRLKDIYSRINKIEENI